MKQRPLLVTLSIGLSTFLALFDVTAVVVELPGIAKNLGFSVTGALLASCVLADRCGRR